MKPLHPDYYLPQEDAPPLSVTGPRRLVEDVKMEFILSKPEYKNQPKNHCQIYMKFKRADGQENIYYYSKWQMSLWERFKILFTGKIYMYAMLPPPNDMPVRGFVSTEALQLGDVIEA